MARGEKLSYTSGKTLKQIQDLVAIRRRTTDGGFQSVQA